MGYIAIAPLVLADTTDGTTVYVYRNGALPENADPVHVAHLLALGLVSDGEFAGGLQPTLSGDGSELDDAVVVEEVPADGPPPKAGLKEDWVAYAVSQGADQAEAEAATKDDLIAKYGA